MKIKKIKRSTKLIGVLFFITLLLIYQTYAILTSEVIGYTNFEIAKWDIYINDMGVMEETIIRIDDINWNANHTAINTLAPGSVGTFPIFINPGDTDVAFRYDISYVDSSVDSNKLLTITSISFNEHELVMTAPNTYSGIFTLDEINSNIIKEITVNVSWINDENNNERDSLIGKGEETEFEYLNFLFSASQYSGEPLIAGWIYKSKYKAL